LEGISPPALSGHIDRLERSGLVTRVRSTTDRRRVGLELTDDGHRILRSVRERRTAWLAERLGALEPAELDAVAAAVDPLRTLLESGA
jgi:DNA-binding MarR family transcriptional regulator